MLEMNLQYFGGRGAAAGVGKGGSTSSMSVGSDTKKTSNTIPQNYVWSRISSDGTVNFTSDNTYNRRDAIDEILGDSKRLTTELQNTLNKMRPIAFDIQNVDVKRAQIFSETNTLYVSAYVSPNKQGGGNGHLLGVNIKLKK